MTCVIYAFWLSVLFAAAEFLLAALAPPQGSDWSFYVPAGEIVYGARGIWQLAAHKVFAFLWVITALALLVRLLIKPAAAYLLRYRGINVVTGFAFAAAVILAIEVIVALPSFPSISSLVSVTVVVYTFPYFVWLLTVIWYFLLSRPVMKVFTAKRSAAAVTVATLIITVAASFAPQLDDRPLPQGPNVLIITVDALRADKVGAAGFKKTLTPNIDRLSAKARVYKRCVTAAPWTLPSLASLHTGLYPPVHGAGLYAGLGPQFPTIAEIFYRAGYDTAAVVGNGFCEPRFGLAQGFMFYRSMEMFPGGLASRLYYTRVPLPFLTRDMLYINTTPIIKKRVVDYIRSRRRQKRPFFLWVHFLDCHGPYTPPPAFAPGGLSGPGAAGAAAKTFSDKAAVEALYDGEVRYVDDAIGDFWDELEKAGLERYTVIVVTADHGEEFWEHGGYEHGHAVYNEVALVPLILKIPREEIHTEINAPVSLIDLYATLADICGVDRRDAVVQSRPLPANDKSVLARAVFVTSLKIPGDDTVAAYARDYKIIATTNRKKIILYDLAADPYERFPQNKPFVVAAFRDTLRAWDEECSVLARYYGVGERRDPAVERQLRAMGYIK